MLNFLVFLALFNSYDALAVYSIDFGCEWIKMALVKPGIPMETVLMPDSSRKLNNIIGIKKDEILIGDPAITYCLKKPKEVYPYVKQILAKNLYSNEIEDYRHRFPQIEMGSLHDRDGLSYIHNNETFLPEELIAMIFERSQEMAAKYAEQPVSGVVITVPPYFTQAERRAIQQAANISKLKLLQIMNENTAVALNYGLFRQKMFNNTPHYVMFFDMGACSSHVSVVAYQNVQVKEDSYVNTYPQLAIKAFGFDRTLGGSAFQLRLRDHLASSFNQEKHATTADVTLDPRAMNKIYVEAGRVMKILSANNEALAQVENLMEGLNMRIKVSRTEFEDMCQDLFDRIRQPIEDALAAAGDEQIAKDDIEQIILFGAATRIPKIQDILKTYSPNTDLGKGINTDEAAALGAVYQAAYLSQGFRAKKFIIKDANAYPIKIEFNKGGDPPSADIDTNEVLSSPKKHISKLLFPRFNPCPQKKVITFNKNFDDFTFNVTYGDLSFLAGDEIKNFYSLNISQVSVTGVKENLAKHTADPKTEFKGIKAHFVLDESCLLQLDSIDIHYEHNGPKAEESTFSKIGNKIKNFFTGSKGEEESSQATAEEPNGTPGDISDNDVDNNNSDKKDKGDNTDREEGGKEGTEDPNSPPEESAQSKNSTADSLWGQGNDSDTANGTNGQNVTTSYHIKESSEFVVKQLDFQPIPPADIKKYQKRLKAYKQKEMDRKELEEACNSLESTLIEFKEKVEYDDVFKSYASEPELETLASKLAEIGQWFEDEGLTAPKNEVNSRLKELKGLIKPIIKRATEHEKRSIAIDAMKQLLNYSENFLESARNLTTTAMPIFTEIEIETLEKLVLTTGDWFRATLAQQSELPKNVDPVLKRDDLVEKIQDLEREVKYLQNKGQAEAMNQAKKFKEQMDAEAKAQKNETKKAGPLPKGSSTTTTDEPDVKKEGGTEETEDKISPEIPVKEEDVTKRPKNAKKGKKKDSAKDGGKERGGKFKRGDVIDDLDLGNDVQKKKERTGEDKHSGDEL